MGRISMLALVVLASSAVAAPLANAQKSAFEAWLGEYRSTSMSVAQDTIDRAIEQGTADMGPMRRAIARKRLKAVNAPAKSVRIVESGDHLVIDFDGRTYRAPLSGKPEQGVDPEGKQITVSYRPEGRTLRGRFIGEDGEKRMDFELAPDDRDLTLHITVLSERLSAPIRYSLRYQRAP